MMTIAESKEFHHESSINGIFILTSSLMLGAIGEGKSYDHK